VIPLDQKTSAGLSHGFTVYDNEAVRVFLLGQELRIAGRLVNRYLDVWTHLTDAACYDTAAQAIIACTICLDSKN